MAYKHGETGGDSNIAPWSKRPLWRRIGGRRGLSKPASVVGSSAAGSSVAGSESGWETPEVELLCDERDAALTQTLEAMGMAHGMTREASTRKTK